MTEQFASLNRVNYAKMLDWYRENIIAEGHLKLLKGNDWSPETRVAYEDGYDDDVVAQLIRHKLLLDVEKTDIARMRCDWFGALTGRGRGMTLKALTAEDLERRIQRLEAAMARLEGEASGFSF